MDDRTIGMAVMKVWRRLDVNVKVCVLCAAVCAAVGLLAH